MGSTSGVFFNKKVEGGRKNVFLFAARPFNGFQLLKFGD